MHSRLFKRSSIQDEVKNLLHSFGAKIVEEVNIGKYDLAVVATPYGDGWLYQVALQKEGKQFTSIRDQMDEGGEGIKEFDRRSLFAAIKLVKDWAKKYHPLFIKSENPVKTKKYLRLFKLMGIKIGYEELPTIGETPYILAE